MVSRVIFATLRYLAVAVLLIIAVVALTGCGFGSTIKIPETYQRVVCPRVLPPLPERYRYNEDRHLPLELRLEKLALEYERAGSTLSLVYEEHGKCESGQ